MASEKDTKITLRISSTVVNQIKKLCIGMSHQEGRVIGMSEFIRGLLEPFCKKEKQLDMFNNEKKNR